MQFNRDINLSSDSALYKLPLIFASVCLLIGVIIAYTSPAQNYELSIYESTPTVFWAAVIINIIISAVYTLLFKQEQKKGLLLVVLSIMSVIALPLIRQYYFFSEGDALTHLGNTKALKTGLLDPLTPLYPGGYILSITLSEILSFTLERAMFLPGLITLLVFIISIPLIVRYATGEKFLSAIAVFSALTLLVVGRNGVHFIPNQIGRLYLACPLILAFFVIDCQDWRYYVLFLITSIGLLFFHPQVMLTLVLILGGISLPFLIRVFQTKQVDNQTITSFIMVTTVAIIMYIWIISKEEFTNVASGLIISLWAPSPGANTVGRTSSLQKVGGSIGEIFTKLFAPHAVFIFVSLVVCATTFHLFFIREGKKSLSEYKRGSKIKILWVFGLLPSFVMFSVSFAASVQYMRYFYISMVLVTLLGVFGIYEFSRRFRTFLSTTGIVVIMIVLLVSMLFVAFPSPYIYLHNYQVSESQIHGYDTTFENRAESIEFVNVRSPPNRYFDATQGTKLNNEVGVFTSKTPDHFADRQLAQYYNNEKYLPITEADRTREPTVYKGFRYNRADFRYLENERSINKVQSNDQYDLYLIS